MGVKKTPVIFTLNLRRKEERGGKKVESSESKEKRKMGDKKVHKRKERKVKTALEMLIIWMEDLT